MGDHSEGIEWYNCSSAHSTALNANMKAYAARWLWCRLAGWGSKKASRKGARGGEARRESRHLYFKTPKTINE